MDSQPTAPSDPSRALQALEQAALSAEGGTLVGQALVVSREDLRALTPGDVRRELDRMILGPRADLGLDQLLKSGVLDLLFPEVKSMVGFGDGEWRHKDVWKHTKQVVTQSVPRLEVRWGALLHDIGKPKTRRIEPDGTVTFYAHSEVGASMFRKRVAKRLGFEGALFDRVHFLILHHLRASKYDGSWTDSAVRRFYKQMGEGLRDLLDLSRADITTKRPERRKRGVAQISALGKRIQEIKSVDAKIAPLPKGLGTLITERLGVPPSKKLGDVRKQLELDVEDGLLEAGQESEYYVAWLEKERERYGI
jgi:poly(A) polymerase